MSKTKFTLTFIVSLLLGFIILGLLKYLNIDLSYNQVLTKLFGQPSLTAKLLVALMTLIICTILIRFIYKQTVKVDES